MSVITPSSSPSHTDGDHGVYLRLVEAVSNRLPAEETDGRRPVQPANMEPIRIRCVCDLFAWEDILGERGVLAFRPFSAIKAGADSQCHLCSLLYGSLRVYNGPEGTTKLKPYCHCVTRTEAQCRLFGQSSFIIIEVSCEGQTHMARLDLSTMPHNIPLDFRHELREIKNRRRNGPEMVGLELDDLAKAWIDDCAHNHPLCPKPQDFPLPTRLVDIGEDSADSFDGLRLVVTTKGTKGKWAALSYSWGQMNDYRTTVGTLEDRLRQIPFNKLPLTVQDAVRATRSLGIRYLWVDVLCIIQDSDEDWQAEAGQMMNVYRNAYVTIAANTGKDANSGLFLDRNPLESRPYEMKFRDPNRNQPTRWRWIHPPRIPWSSVVKKAHLQTRGWTLQETNLSARVIYYDEWGLFWQCREGIRQERVPAYLITANDPLVPRRIFDGYADEPMNIFTLWCNLVEDFTARNLTCEMDKLFAIAGLASAISVFLQSRSERRLASPEEKELFSPREVPRHWAVPENPTAVGTLRHDGGNASFRHILIAEELAAGRPIYTHVRGPLSTDPFLTMRYIGGIDPDADWALINPNPRTREIMENVGLGPLLLFKENTDNPDFYDEYVQLMSHPDTHAAYHRAYRIWKAEKDEKEAAVENRDSNCVQARPDQERGPQPAQDKFWAEVSAHDDGYYLDPDTETGSPIPQRTNMYVYGDVSPVKARIEWPGYVMDETYLAGIWKVDLFYQLQWYCPKPGRRSPQYRAPSWSWASMDNTAIRYEHDKLSYSRQEDENWSNKWDARILDAVIVPRGPSRFGDVRSAKLTLLALVREMPFYADVDVVPSEANSPSVVPKSEVADTLPSPGRQHLCLDEEFTRLHPSLKVLRLNSTSCLIVEPVVNSVEPKVFKRVGYWMCPRRGSVTFGPLNGGEALGGWETKVVILI